MQAEMQSDVRKNPRRIAFILRRTSPYVKTQDDGRVMTYPTALSRFIIALEVAFVLLVWISLLANAPLEGAVLDIDLAGEPSFPMCKALNARGVPFVFLSAYSSVVTIVPPEFRTAPSCPCAGSRRATSIGSARRRDGSRSGRASPDSLPT